MDVVPDFQSSVREASRRRKWTAEEDTRLIELVQRFGIDNWRLVGLEMRVRDGKQCRERWSNHLDPAVKKGKLTLREWKALIEAHERFGNKWSDIAVLLPGRTPNTLKNFWHSNLRALAIKELYGIPIEQQRSPSPSPSPAPSPHHHHLFKAEPTTGASFDADRSEPSDVMDVDTPNPVASRPPPPALFGFPSPQLNPVTVPHPMGAPAFPALPAMLPPVPPPPSFIPPFPMQPLAPSVSAHAPYPSAAPLSPSRPPPSFSLSALTSDETEDKMSLGGGGPQQPEVLWTTLIDAAVSEYKGLVQLHPNPASLFAPPQHASVEFTYDSSMASSEKGFGSWSH